MTTAEKSSAFLLSQTDTTCYARGTGPFSVVNFRMDEQLKKNMDEPCRKMGMSMTTAFTMLATKVTREQRIPFEVPADPFYSEANQKHL